MRGSYFWKVNVARLGFSCARHRHIAMHRSTLGVEELEKRCLLAVGSFMRTNGDVDTQGSVSATDLDPPPTYVIGHDVGDEPETYAYSKTITSKGGAFAENQAEVLAIPPVDYGTPAPYVSADCVEKRSAFDYSGASGETFADAASLVRYDADPEFTEDLELHGHLWLAASVGAVEIDDASAGTDDHGLSVYSQAGEAYINARYFSGAPNYGEWTYEGYIPGFGENGEVSGTSGGGQLNLHFYFVADVNDDDEFLIWASSGGDSYAFAEDGNVEFLALLHAGAWAYVTEIGTDDSPGDFNHDGSVDVDDYRMWTSGDPRADEDLDGDIDADDFNT